MATIHIAGTEISTTDETALDIYAKAHEAARTGTIQRVAVRDRNGRLVATFIGAGLAVVVRFEGVEPDGFRAAMGPEAGDVAMYTEGGTGPNIW